MTSRILSSTDRADKTGRFLQNDPTEQGLSAAQESDSIFSSERTPGNAAFEKKDRLHTASFLTRQRELLKRRLWPFSLTFLGFFLYNVVGAATVLIVASQEAAAQRMGRAQTAALLAKAAGGLFGTQSVCPFLIVFPLAVVLAIEGFSWMDSRREVDFYESLPAPRRQRFIDICASGFLYFLLSYLATLEAGLLIAGAMGALTKSLLLIVLKQFFRTAAFFLAIYGLGVLSAMLTGNVVVAGLAFLVLLLYEKEFKLVLRGYCSQFLSTWSGRAPGLLTDNIFDPFYHYSAMFGFVEGSLRLIALAAVYFLLAWLCFYLRKNECAGTAVVFGPVRSASRVAVSLIVGLVAGLLFSAFQNEPFLPVMWMLLFVVITSCIMQIIYDYDFKSLFHRPVEIALAAALALVIYFGFLFDVAGYDRFTPDPGKTADAAISFSDTYSDDALYNERGEYIDRSSFAEEYMHLENVEDVIAIAQYGQEYTRKSDRLHGREDLIYIDSPLAGTYGNAIENNTPTYHCTVIYRMKNGETSARSFRLPCSADPAAMEAVIGTKAYREGAFSIYHDDAVRFSADSFTMDYTNAMEYAYRKMDSAKYEAFRSAYIRDLEQFSYRFATNNRPVGRLTLTCESRRGTASGEAFDEGGSDPSPVILEGILEEGSSIGYPVYSTFANTIAFLKDNGLWIDSLDYDALPSWDNENLSRSEQELLNTIDFSILSGPFCLPEY